MRLRHRLVRSGLDELAAVWLAAIDQIVVTAASHRLEQDLARDPYNRGVRRNSSVNRTATARPSRCFPNCEADTQTKKGAEDKQTAMGLAAVAGFSRSIGWANRGLL